MLNNWDDIEKDALVYMQYLRVLNPNPEENELPPPFKIKYIYDKQSKKFEDSYMNLKPIFPEM